MTFVECYKFRKETADCASKALDRVIRPNQIKCVKHQGRVISYIKGLSEQEVRKYLSYLRYGNTNTVSNGFVSTPVSTGHDVKCNTEDTEWMNGAWDKLKI